MITREQRFAAGAYSRVQAFAEATSDKTARKQYKSMAQELPILIRRAGLLQALAFIDRSSADADKVLAEDVAQTALQVSRLELFARSRDLPILQYMRMTDQVMAACAWYKRAAQVVLDEPLAGPVQQATASDLALVEGG